MAEGFVAEAPVASAFVAAALAVFVAAALVAEGFSPVGVEVQAQPRDGGGGDHAAEHRPLVSDRRLGLRQVTHAR